MKKINKILIANRGEIASRVIRTCKAMGLQTVAVYSEVDKGLPYVREADQAYCIGPAESSQSYLDISKIIDVAKESGADAIHPGYGFLSEKADFSKACEEAGVVFIGPKPHVISQMGDKIKARLLAQKAKVPVVPGTVDPIQSVSEVQAFVKKYGFPILLKAAAGGGGKGMRVVREHSELESAFKQASGEALKSFGDARVFVEKYIQNPKHVEVQVFGDQHGNAVHLFERECSTQRRHQKIIEEAPCFYLKESVRKKMTKAAVNLTQNIGYTGAGTIEFLVDDKQEFYFLEMNTRLQVEHPVTEMITGFDLVEWQIRVAQGEKLPVSQKQIQKQGHAIECRIYAEDPAKDFAPQPGLLLQVQEPNADCRWESGVVSGSEISIYYDPMIAKLIVYAADRMTCIQVMQTALSQVVLLGPQCNVSFLKRLLAADVFQKGQIHTQYLDQHRGEWTKALPLSKDLIQFAAALKLQKEKNTPMLSQSNWWSVGQASQMEDL